MATFPILPDDMPDDTDDETPTEPQRTLPAAWRPADLSAPSVWRHAEAQVRQEPCLVPCLLCKRAVDLNSEDAHIVPAVMHLEQPERPRATPPSVLYCTACYRRLDFERWLVNTCRLTDYEDGIAVLREH